MALVGLSILIVSISFLCYRGHATSWPWLAWLRRRPSIEAAKGPAPIVNNHDGSNEMEKTPRVTKEEQDRKAMPPPPPSLKTPIVSKPPSPPTTPRASITAAPPVPSFNLDDSPPAPSFPAANSAQRASGGRHGPPRLNPSAGLSSSSLMPPPRGPLPNRLPQVSSSLAPPTTPNAIPPRPRRKVLLSPGHSPLDWARVSSAPGADLRNLPPGTPYLKVPPSLLRRYTGRKGKDAWTVLGGKVYNISPYLPYHPGGEPELLKAAGRDGTRLFGEVHPWVNWEGMLEGCLVGIAVEEGDVRATGSTLEDMD